MAELDCLSSGEVSKLYFDTIVLPGKTYIRPNIGLEVTSLHYVCCLFQRRGSKLINNLGVVFFKLARGEVLIGHKVEHSVRETFTRLPWSDFRRRRVKVDCPVVE